MTKSEANDDQGASVLQLREIGDAVGFILPEEVLARLKLRAGDKLHLTEQADGAFTLSAHDPVHARGMAIARQAFHDYAETFKALAK